MAESMNGLKRTDYCGKFTIKDLNRQVVINGWVQKRRNLGGLIFVDVRDKTGIVQVVFNSERSGELFAKAELLKSEYVVAVKGTVGERANKTDKIPTGEIEINASDLKILAEAETTPFEIVDDTKAGEQLRLKYRYLDLRRPTLQNILSVRYAITKATRDYLDKIGFTEIETPMLGKSTPEGARDYLVPSRIRQGCFYALPQSPQLYKQLLMIAGTDRYFQITKCFRDEDLRANRQPEFTQIDLEMSFVEDETDVMYPIEELIKDIFKKAGGITLPDGHFRTMTYRQAMDEYGSDKPDTRFGLKIVNVSNLVENCAFKVFTDAVKIGSVRCINAKGLASKLSRKELDALGEFVKTAGAKGLCWMTKLGGEFKSPIAKFLSEEELNAIFNATNFEDGDALLFVADKNNAVFSALGALRLHLADKFNLYDKSEFDILWVTEFPMFEFSEEENRYVAVHHPFTAMKDEDLEYLETDKGRIRAKAYDLVINGQEAGGGSIRIHRQDVQKRVFKALGLTDEDVKNKFGFFVEAFKYGAPPHGGLAFGLDRLAMLLTGTDNIKDVIAFPKVQNASCLMSNAPDVVEEKQLQELGIEIKKQ